MALLNLFSKRKKRERGEVPDVLVYDRFPEPLRVQLSHILDDLLGGARAGEDQYTNSFQAYTQIVVALRREYGVDSLVKGHSYQRMSAYDELHLFVRVEGDIERVLDGLDLAHTMCERSYGLPGHAHLADITSELNARFLENGVGYQFESGEVIRTDSKLLHAQAVKPALVLLADPLFRGAEEEFLEAFTHHRHGREKDAMVWCLKALESTLKVICAQRGWAATGDQAKQLLDAVFERGLIDPMWQSEFSGLRSVLESGVPTARNKRSGHGQGAVPVHVPGYLAAFVVHQAAAAIVFLVEAHRAKP